MGFPSLGRSVLVRWQVRTCPSQSPTETGQPQDATNLYRRWLTAATETAGVPWAAFPSLRHTAASRRLQTGYSHAIVSRLLGHSDPAFTMRVYVHVRNDDLPDGDDIAAAVGSWRGVSALLVAAQTPEARPRTSAPGRASTTG